MSGEQGKRKRSDNGWKGKPKRSRKDDLPPQDDDEPQYTNRHPGSFPIDDVKSYPGYQPIDESVPHIKRKYALCFSYLGSAYQGLQINPDCKSVEAELERALFLAGGIIESNFGFMTKIQWTRAARTDRGVHAISQCCAMKLLVDPDKRHEFIDKVNSLLPSDIRLQGMTKVAKSFNSKNLCSKRTYHYLLPTYVLQDTAITTALLQDAYTRQGPLVGAGYEGGYIDPATSRSLNRSHLDECYQTLKNYRVSPEVLAVLRETLQMYHGTRGYHNFTSGKDASEMNAKRYMISFTAGEPFVVESTGVEYVLLAVQGQSFLLNQIRKMVAFAVAVARGDATSADLSTAFEPAQVFVPMAPSLGLYLFELFFDGYNMKQRRDGERDRHAQLRAAQKAAAKAAAAPTTTATATATAAPTSTADVAAPATTTEGEAANDGNDGPDGQEDKDDNDEGQTREEIEWYEDAQIRSRLHAFKDEVLHPHIFQEEQSSLSYMYYLDYLRAFPQTYKPRRPIEAKEESSSSS